MTDEGFDEINRLLACLIISLVFWLGLELIMSVTAGFKWQVVVGGTMLTTLFLYGCVVYEEYKKKSDK